MDRSDRLPVCTPPNLHSIMNGHGLDSGRLLSAQGLANTAIECWRKLAAFSEIPS